MYAMPFAFGREKALPDIPVDVDAVTLEDEGLWLVPSPRSATSTTTNKALPSIKAESVLSEEEMTRLHDLWNGAGLSARAHRRRRRGHNHPPRRIPAPISIPEPGYTPPALSAVHPPITSTTPSTTGTWKRWGFLSARPFSEAQAVEKKASKLGTLRAKAQNQLKKKLRHAKSAPNLGDQGTATLQPPMPVSAKTAPKDTDAGVPRTPVSPHESTANEPVLQPENMDENALYFTIDPNWRASQGSVEFLFITPIPDSPSSLGRPDSPLQHRHPSLDQLTFAAQEAMKKGLTTTEFPEAYPSEGVFHLIDALHTYPEL